MKENDELTPSQRYEKAHTSYDELRNLLEASTQEKVVLTKKEIEKGKERKRSLKTILKRLLILQYIEHTINQ